MVVIRPLLGDVGTLVVGAMAGDARQEAYSQKEKFGDAWQKTQNYLRK